MIVITHPRPTTRLSTLLDSPGGISVGVALERARQNISVLKTRGLLEVSRHIEELVALPQPTEGDETAERLQQIYQSANHLIDAAGPFELEEICAVAISLCDMVDRAAVEREFDWRILAVHIRSLQLLNTLPAGAVAERAQVTAHLADMVARKFGQAG